MAPPLKSEAEVFVIAKMPMATCPLRKSAADRPDHILAVGTQPIVRPASSNVAIETRGILKRVAQTDAETGFVSRVRLVDAVHA